VFLFSSVSVVSDVSVTAVLSSSTVSVAVVPQAVRAETSISVLSSIAMVFFMVGSLLCLI
jgi:hypothetical protein